MKSASCQKMSEDFMEYMKGRQFSRNTLKTTRITIKLFLEWVDNERMEPEQVSYQDLLGFMKYCSQKGTTQRTIQHYLNTVRHYYNYLEEEDRVSANPTLGIEVKGVKRQVLYHIIEPHELHALYNQYPSENHRDRRNKVMLGLLVYQGIRTEELSRITIKEVKLREGKIDVLGSRKSNGRLMQLENHQIMDMYDYTLQVRPEILQMEPKRKSQSRIETDQLFIGEGGNCYSISNFITQLMIKVRKINPSVRNAQQIRASVITKWVKMYNLRKAQYLARHRYISTTESYLQNDLEGLKEEINQYHPLG
ncbi:MAG: site-specific integrase [Cytophagales bacterium]|nr:site-specific integrase [Cytophagales bacterium]